MIMTARGKAFEYAIAQQLSGLAGIPIVDDRPSEAAAGFYANQADSAGMDRAASEAVMFLQANDKRFDEAESILIQPDAKGQSGDVRDIVVPIFGGEIGISAKNNSDAVKHSRLSPTIDFGMRWGGHEVSQEYWNGVRPTFETMAAMREDGKLFREIPDKETRFYLPILAAFEDEFERLCKSYGTPFIRRVFQYIVGNQDYYKVVRLARRKELVLQPFNINGTLEWGRRWRIPQGIERIRRAPRTKNRLVVTFDGGWRVSFRIHNASARVEPSLKFDIKFEAFPAYVLNHTISLQDNRI